MSTPDVTVCIHAQWDVHDGWWYPAAAIFYVSLFVFLAQLLRGFCATSCGAGPSLWRHTREVTEEKEWRELYEFIARQCDTQAGHYSFRMALHDAWRCQGRAHAADMSAGCSRLRL